MIQTFALRVENV